MASLSHSPASSTDAHSDVESPRVTKQTCLALANTPQLHAKVKQQRSSSINSLTSTQSTHQRSLSLVSLESPRNSIVSIDDIFIRPTRNNSNSSLASLGGAGSPKEVPKDHFPLSSRLPKSKFKSSCVILSDEEISESEHHPSRSVNWRRKSSEKKQKPSFLSSLKKDFKFKYDREIKQKPVLNSVTSTPVTARLLEDSHPSPLSLSVEGTHQATIQATNTCLAATPLNILEDDAASAVRPSLPAKKLRSSSMTQSMFLKKKLLLSKDIQLELLSSHQSTFPSPTSAVPDTRYPFPSVKLPMPTRDLIHNFFSSHSNDPIPHQHISPLASAGAHPLALSLPAKPAHLISRSISPSNSTPITHYHPIESSLVEQNELLSKLNRKWNKTAFSGSPEGDLSDSIFNSVVSTKKRSRSELASSTDSFSVASAN